MENVNMGAKQHRITMTNRRICTITGVKDVLSFDVREVLLETELGMMEVKGEDLHVSRLSLDVGEVDLDGKVDSLTYSDVSNPNHKGESLLAKLFR